MQKHTHTHSHTNLHQKGLIFYLKTESDLFLYMRRHYLLLETVTNHITYRFYYFYLKPSV